MENLYAVIWVDEGLGGLMLHLSFPNAESAINRARQMAISKVGGLKEIRAVSLPREAVKLTTLWSPI